MKARGLNARSVALFLIYWALQAIAAVLFKWGSTSDALWLPMFVLGNVFGGGSIWFMMLLYRHMNPNVVLGICVGGGFLSAQAAVAIVFHSILAPAQWFGLFAITAGMVALAMGGRPEPSAEGHLP